MLWSGFDPIPHPSCSKLPHIPQGCMSFIHVFRRKKMFSETTGCVPDYTLSTPLHALHTRVKNIWWSWYELFWYFSSHHLDNYNIWTTISFYSSPQTVVSLVVPISHPCHVCVYFISLVTTIHHSSRLTLMETKKIGHGGLVGREWSECKRLSIRSFLKHSIFHRCHLRMNTSKKCSKIVFVTAKMMNCQCDTAASFNGIRNGFEKK